MAQNPAAGHTWWAKLMMASSLCVGAMVSVPACGQRGDGSTAGVSSVMGGGGGEEPRSTLDGAPPDAAPRDGSADGELSDGAGGGGERPERGVDGVRWDDPSAMAREALERLRGHNLADLLLVATDANQGHRVTRSADQTVGAALFGPESWRARAVAGWSGRLGPARVSGDEAWIAFADLPRDRVAVVMLLREHGQWRLHDLRAHSRRRFDSFGVAVRDASSGDGEP